ncbi:hypothetical protein LCGC14_2358060 [marine sediment metagenome]|uniref:Uncharacterized protein n=1 Tax=marine sediment metagenome TaxID=412755 RepID=A0A0F9EJW3_9ZZZZ
MSLLEKIHYSKLEKSIIVTAEAVLSKAMARLRKLLDPHGSERNTRTAEVRRPEIKQTVVTTRRGLRIVVNENEVCFYGQKDMIRADWIEIPGIIASLRSALVPHDHEKTISQAHIESGLELATGFAGSLDDYIFTVGDAEDIVKTRMFVTECPDRKIAGEINHVMLIGSRKLYRYIEEELQTQ